MYGLGKKRSRFGEWLDNRGISQQWVATQSKVSRSTISDLCKDESTHTPSQATMKKILTAIRKIDPTVKVDDFWDM